MIWFNFRDWAPTQLPDPVPASAGIFVGAGSAASREYLTLTPRNEIYQCDPVSARIVCQP